MANPACCCTIGDLLHREVAENTPPFYASCCAEKQSPPSDSEKEQPDDCPDCPCRKGHSAAVESKNAELGTAFAVNLLPTPPSFSLAQPAYRPASLALALPAHLALPPPGPSWQMFCRYLL